VNGARGCEPGAFGIGVGRGGVEGVSSGALGGGLLGAGLAGAGLAGTGVVGIGGGSLTGDPVGPALGTAWSEHRSVAGNERNSILKKVSGGVGLCRVCIREPSSR
jgi:hypothetical protein